MSEEKCRSCKGTGRQIFHSSFESTVGKCNFCGGSGSGEDETEFYNRLSRGRKIHKVLDKCKHLLKEASNEAGKVNKKMARDAAKKVLYAKNSSKKEKVKRGSALTQRSK